MVYRMLRKSRFGVFSLLGEKVRDKGKQDASMCCLSTRIRNFNLLNIQFKFKTGLVFLHHGNIRMKIMIDGGKPNMIHTCTCNLQPYEVYLYPAMQQNQNK